MLEIFSVGIKGKDTIEFEINEELAQIAEESFLLDVITEEEQRIIAEITCNIISRIKGE